MKTQLKLIIAIFILSLSFSTYAQEQKEKSYQTKEFKHSISACPVAVAFGIYSINYEYLHNQKHGFVARFDYEAIPKTYTDANIESNGCSVLLNYRYHIDKKMNSCFVGAYARYREFNGDGMINETAFDFNMPDVSFGINAGKKWVWNSGFTMTFALGYGFSNEDWDSNPDTVEVNDVIKDYRKAYDFIDPFYGEFSIGYSF
ncbi:Protein of unknown function [Lutibacter oricola]|uniref:DUF3575 domain-containing protein n=1 Tax=Lutibacter oricola TaxID=762486 RepID=A0A1H2SP80_9FLAO|nr:DUF3575 domain-containing protein [Lutibacter oricola]SDW33451.1 Protein of unknown function [Lutibacter oricola]